MPLSAPIVNKSFHLETNALDAKDRSHGPSSADGTLTADRLPAVLQHLTEYITQLPAALISSLAASALAHGFEDELFEQGLKDAITFQNQPAHRCGYCFRWCDAPYLILILVTDRGFVFASCCDRCEKRMDRKQVTAEMWRNLTSLVADATGGAK
jgi:hypothetical protein